MFIRKSLNPKLDKLLKFNSQPHSYNDKNKNDTINKDININNNNYTLNKNNQNELLTTLKKKEKGLNQQKHQKQSKLITKNQINPYQQYLIKNETDLSQSKNNINYQRKSKKNCKKQSLKQDQLQSQYYNINNFQETAQTFYPMHITQQNIHHSNTHQLKNNIYSSANIPRNRTQSLLQKSQKQLQKYKNPQFQFYKKLKMEQNLIIKKNLSNSILSLPKVSSKYLQQTLTNLYSPIITEGNNNRYDNVNGSNNNQRNQSNNTDIRHKSLSQKKYKNYHQIQNHQNKISEFKKFSPIPSSCVIKYKHFQQTYNKSIQKFSKNNAEIMKDSVTIRKYGKFFN